MAPLLARRSKGGTGAESGAPQLSSQMSSPYRLSKFEDEVCLRYLTEYEIVSTKEFQ
jgi:hypothetical protein